MTSLLSSRRLIVFATLLCAILILLLITLPTSDPIAYFEFADQRTLLGVTNMWDVMSNFGFFFVGLVGLWKWRKNRQLQLSGNVEITNQIYFQFAISVAIIWTCFGSAYFHDHPGLERVFWDRLPMTFVFSTIVGWLIADKINFTWGTLVAVVLSISGAVFLVLWKYEIYHLKPYYLLQYGGLIAALLLCALFPEGRYSNSKFYFTFAVYIIAKLTEHSDRPIFEILGFMSGHTIKHFLAAYAIWILVQMQPKSRKSFDSLLSR